MQYSMASVQHTHVLPLTSLGPLTSSRLDPAPLHAQASSPRDDNHILIFFRSSSWSCTGAGTQHTRATRHTQIARSPATVCDAGTDRVKV
jgi:hypothetical protein